MQNEEQTQKLEPEKWVERYGDALYAFAMARLNRPDIAQDLVQDTFASAWKARETFMAQATEKTWLISILKRKIIDHYRKKSTQNELNVLDNDRKDHFIGRFFNSDNEHDGHWNGTSVPKAWKNDFGTPVESEEFYNVLKGCLGKLPEKWAAVFTMKNMDDMETEEICKELGITPSNYWVIMHRAKLQLRECMEKNWFGK